MMTKRFWKLLTVLCMLTLLLLGCSADAGEPKDSETETSFAESESTKESESETEAQTEEKSTETEKKEENQFVNMWTYSTDENGAIVRDVVIDSGMGGESVEIIHLTDIHINYCNDEDLKDPVLKSTYENRKWLANFSSLTNLQRCLKHAERADQLVITGDLFDYLSMGAIEKAKKYIFDVYPNVLACLGNHESVKKMQGEVAENTTLDERLAVLEENWCNDIYYESRVLKDKVMLIAMDNASRGGIGSFWDSQVPLLEADLAKAREKGYVVLLFYHIPISTGNPADGAKKANLIGDKNSSVINFYKNCVGKTSTGADWQIYDLIVNNADIIKGTFCGHHHNDFYTEIIGRGADGSFMKIPQYVVCGVPYLNGHVMRITVK